VIGASMPVMTTPKPLHIFKSGTVTDLHGRTVTLTPADLAASAAAYDPAKHEAPIVIGHPRHNAPAYGWVKSMAAAASDLFATPQQVDLAFAEGVDAGRWKKISASFFEPTAPNNPVPGVYYLRHVGFLGAMPPAVKGLRPVEFGDSEEGIVCFGDWADRTNASLWRRLRDWFISEKGLEKADSVISDWAVAALEEDANKPEPDDTAPAEVAVSFSDPLNQETLVTPEQAAALEAENAQLKTRLAAVDASAREAAAAQRHGAHLDFAEGLAASGKLKKAQTGVVVAFMDFVADAPLEFGEGDEKQPLVDAFKGFLNELPPALDFGEQAGKDRIAEKLVANPLVADAEARAKQS